MNTQDHESAEQPKAPVPTHGGMDREMLMEGLTLARYFVAGGVRRFEDYAKQMADALGDAFDAYRGHLRQFYESVRYDPGSTDWRDEMTPSAELDALESSGSMEMLLADTARLREAAERGDAEAQVRLASGLRKISGSGESVVHAHRQAAEWFRKAAEQGHAGAQGALGAMYHVGQGVALDHRRAALWFRRVAEQGYAHAQFVLGLMYTSGEGVAENHPQAALWYRKAAEQGHADAQCALGSVYGMGQGVALDYVQAALWYRKAAEQGQADAQNNLGTMFGIGRGVAEDHRQAALWYRKAAEQGHAAAQYNLAGSYANGDGVPQDTVQAYAWLNLAAAQGFTEAVSERAAMESVMTLSELAEAQSLSRQLARHAAD